MSKPVVSVLYAPGTNSHAETMWAFERVGARAELLFLSDVLSGSRRLGDADALCIPGGFAFGDHLGAGNLAGQLLRRSGNLDELTAKPVIAICNGFQIAVRAGLFGDGVSLTANGSGTFRNIVRQPHVVEPENNSVWLQGLDSQTLFFPCAHGEGRLVTHDNAAASMRVLSYPEGENPDGSVDDIAGIASADGMFFGLMDHPERAPDGPGNLDIFANGVLAAQV